MLKRKREITHNQLIKVIEKLTGKVKKLEAKEHARTHYLAKRVASRQQKMRERNITMLRTLKERIKRFERWDNYFKKTKLVGPSGGSRNGYIPRMTQQEYQYFRHLVRRSRKFAHRSKASHSTTIILQNRPPQQPVTNIAPATFPEGTTGTPIPKGHVTIS